MHAREARVGACRAGVAPPSNQPAAACSLCSASEPCAGGPPHARHRQGLHSTRPPPWLTDSLSVCSTVSAPYSRLSESVVATPSTQPAWSSAAHVASASPGA